MMVIGLTGVPSVGKGCVNDFLVDWCERRGRRVAHLSFSDEIKAEARARGVRDDQFERELLRGIVTEMRAAEGAGVLADRLAKRILAVPAAERADLYMVESLRHPDEIARLRAAFGKDFALVAVTAELTRVADWMMARRRDDESRAALRSRRGALALLERELKGDGGNLAVRVGECIAAADYTIDNNGTLDELRARSEALAQALLA